MMSFQEQVNKDRTLYEIVKDEKYFIESYKRMETFLYSIRNEKVWKNFKLLDAQFSYNQIKENFSTLFHPIIEILEIETKFQQWILCPMDEIVNELENMCDISLENIITLNSKLNFYEKEENLFQSSSIQNITLEYLLIESEILLLQAIVELKRNNFMSSAHKFLKSYQKMNEGKKIVTIQYHEDGKKGKYETAYFLKMCENRPSVCDKKLLNALSKLIEEKLAEIRILYQPASTADENTEDSAEPELKERYSDMKGRNVPVSDSLLQATRDLLHLKQLYKELSQEYQKFEEERKSLEKEMKKQNSKGKKEVHYEDDLENCHPNLQRTQSTQGKPKGLSLKKPSTQQKSGFSWNIASVSETCGNFISSAVDKIIYTSNTTTTVASAATSTETSTDKDTTKSIVNSLMSPKKVEMPVVSVLLPRISDVAKMLEIETSVSIKRRKSQTKASDTNGKGKSTNMKKLAHLDLASQQPGFSSPSGKKLSSSSPHSTYTIFDDEDFDYKAYWDIFQNDFQESFFIQSKSRIAFIEGIFSVGLSMLPSNTQWVLEIVKGSSMNLRKALNSLYKIHLFEESRWSQFATLALINLSKEMYAPFWNQKKSSLSFIKDISIQNLDQIYQVIEAQSMLKSWASKNPLWLYSLAVQSCPSTELGDNDFITTHIHKRIDYYRRAITTESDAVDLSKYLGYYELKNSLARDLMRTGNWILALNLSKEIAPKLSSSFSFLYNYTIIQSCSAALITSEYFNCQKVFLPLKFSNKFIQNTNLSAENHYNYQEISDIVAAFNFHSSMSSIKSTCPNLQNIPFQYQTLIHRVREYEEYFVMLQNEMKAHDLLTSLETINEEEAVHETDREQQQFEGQDDMAIIHEDVDHPLDSQEPISEESITLSLNICSEFDQMVMKRKEESLKVDFYCFWSWLMPLESIYLFFRPLGHVHEAAHSSLLNICDKGALLFADKYLLKSVEYFNFETQSITSEEQALGMAPGSSNNPSKPAMNPEEAPYLQMGNFIKSIIIDELISHDPTIIRKAIYPTSKLRLYMEEILMTGEKQLRIDCDENYTLLLSGRSSTTNSASSNTATSSANPAASNASAGSSTSFFQILGNPLALTGSYVTDKQFIDQRTVKMLLKLKERHEHYNEDLAGFYQRSATNLNNQQQNHEINEEDSNYWIPLETPKRPYKVYGDQLITWLLLRGLILLELNRVGEAIMMFKLMECYKETAPRTKFAMFVAYYHLAEIVLQYEVCDYPLLVATEYLKRASVYMQRAYESKCYHYIHEYHPKILELTEKLLTNFVVNK